MPTTAKSFLVTAFSNGAIEIFDITKEMALTPRHDPGPPVYMGVDTSAGLEALGKAITE